MLQRDILMDELTIYPGNITQSSDASLVERLRSNNNDSELAFTELYMRYRASLMRYLENRLRPRHASMDEIEDVATDVWMSTYDSCRNGTVEGSHFRAFLYTVAEEKFRAFLPKTNPTPLQLPSSEEEAIVETALSPEDSVVAASIRVAIMDALQSLPEEQRLVLTLHLFENLSYKDIAHRQGVTESSVSKSSKQAIQKIKQALTKEGLLESR